MVITGLLSVGDEGLEAPPITSDPPFHTDFRRILLPAFGPKLITEWEPRIRGLANSRIDTFIEKGKCDAAAEYAKQIPVTVIALMVGVPPEDGDLFTEWVHQLLEVSPTDPEAATEGLGSMISYLSAKIAERRASPQDDLISTLLEAEIEGEKLSDMRILGTVILLMPAGIDTTWSSIGAGLWHLSHHPDDLARLVDDPKLMDTAVEEFLRAYAPVTMAREVVKETQLGGETLCPGDKLLPPFPAGNRDPAAFPDADKVLIDRAVNRHHAFGAGIHRCLGSNLARLELSVALEEFIRRIPAFHLADPAAVTWSSGQVRGPRALPLVFDSVKS